jgi:hypothetical protein
MKTFFVDLTVVSCNLRVEELIIKPMIQILNDNLAEVKSNDAYLGIEK